MVLFKLSQGGFCSCLTIHHLLQDSYYPFMDKKGKIMNIQAFKNEPEYLKLFLKYKQLYFFNIGNFWNALKVNSRICVVLWGYINFTADNVFLNCFDFILGSSMLQVQFLILLCFYRNWIQNSFCFNLQVFSQIWWRGS